MQMTVCSWCQENPKDISNTLTKELQSCREWLVDNKLSLHLGKTEAILCGSKRNLKNAQDFELKCNGVSISSVSVVKYLGLNIALICQGNQFGNQ